LNQSFKIWIFVSYRFIPANRSQAVDSSKALPLDVCDLFSFIHLYTRFLCHCPARLSQTLSDCGKPGVRKAIHDRSNLACNLSFDLFQPNLQFVVTSKLGSCICLLNLAQSCSLLTFISGIVEAFQKLRRLFTTPSF
jgi:hypothetical protein